MAVGTLALARRAGPVLAAITVLHLAPGGLSAQAIEQVGDSVRVSFVNTDIRAAIQALGRLLEKPVLAGPLGDVRIEVFETPVPVHRDALAEILRGLVRESDRTWSIDRWWSHPTSSSVGPWRPGRARPGTHRGV